ncbi:MAG: phosphatidate cytidylyltransferase [Oscillospiraceae bacterium]|nr:phosphatidate cytidylyltransferase [Oscillospiraceae bacterium]
MLKRTIVALVLAPVLLVVVLFAPEIVTAGFVAVFSAIAAYEMLHGTKLVTEGRMLAYTMTAAFLVPLWSYFGGSHVLAVLGLLAFYILLFSELMISGLKVSFSKAAMCVVAGLVIPFMFSSLVRILCMEKGRYFILAPFVAAFMSDIGAYLVGCSIGKHKLCPVISPKKTVEGLVGGIVFAALGMLAYGFILQHFFDLKVNFIYIAIYGLAGSLCGVFGDLSFSVIKRQTGIKDYGKIFPGHGGILDRFDSVIVVAPLVEALLDIMPMA